MGFYYLKNVFLRLTLEFLLDLYGYGRVNRYDDILNHISKKEKNKIFGFDYVHEVYILVKLLLDAKYIEQTDSIVQFRISEGINPYDTLENVLKRLPYKLTEEELDKMTIGYTGGNFDKWFDKNREELETCGCDFLHWDPYHTWHRKPYKLR